MTYNATTTAFTEPFTGTKYRLLKLKLQLGLLQFTVFKAVSTWRRAKDKLLSQTQLNTQAFCINFLYNAAGSSIIAKPLQPRTDHRFNNI